MINGGISMKQKIIVCVGLALSSVAPMRAGWLDTVKANVGKYATGVQVQANVCKNATQNANAGTPVEDAANYIHETATHIAKNGLTNQQMAAASIIGAYGLHKVRDAHFTGYNPCNMRNVVALGTAALAGYLGRDTVYDTSLLATTAFVGTKSILDYICKRSVSANIEFTGGVFSGKYTFSRFGVEYSDKISIKNFKAPDVSLPTWLP